MGNAATLPYDIAQQIDYNGSINWTLHDASKKVILQLNMDIILVLQFSFFYI